MPKKQSFLNAFMKSPFGDGRKKVEAEANKVSRRIDSDRWIEVPEGMSSFDLRKHREANKNES